ncbi:breast cancer type 1 susceptibility protein homolog isoform X2 [Hoplias malabaricus]|uniref:breast cancer type 1 susceptibility protein homolog isoform X2 n=1 Tax=Hoplias malabaricus TaxID=27720 RepID=UPI003461914D
MTAPKAEDVRRGIAVIWENLQCPICLDLMNAPVSTRCDHQFCKFCMMKLLERSKRKEANCPVCKMKVTKRSLKESPGFQRLVEGLQNLIQSYEFDTCTNWMPQMRKETSVETDSRDQQCSEENTISENVVMEKSESHSSSAAAKDAFAKLMDLPNSCQIISEQDCSDSGLGDLPQETEKRPAETEEDVPSRTVVRPSHLLTHNDDTNPGGDTTMPRNCSSKQLKGKRVCLEPNRIVDKRQKKSVEKVAEWLLNISPSSDSKTKGNSRLVSDDSESENESVCSLSSADFNMQVDKKDKISPQREVPGRGLEEQVFGAVYKRERRIIKTKALGQRIKDLSPEKEIVTDPQPLVSKEKEVEIIRNVPKRKKIHLLTPADFIKESSSNDKEERVVYDEKENDPKSIHDTVEENKQDHVAESNMDEPTNCLEEHQKVVENFQDENCDDKVENMEESPIFEVPVKRPTRRSKANMQDVWQYVDSDLKEKENTCNKTSRNRRVTRNNFEITKDGHLEENNNAKGTKSLNLVTATGNENATLMRQLRSKPKLVEAEINIESYPSSAEPQSPDARKTRRSLRLQAFTEEVQGPRKRKRSIQNPMKPVEGSENNPPANQSQSNCGNLTHPKTIGETADAKQDAHILIGKTDQSGIEKNGCVYNRNFETIETIQMNEKSGTLACVSDGDIPEQNFLLSVVPDTVDDNKHNVPFSSMAVSSPRSLVAVAPDLLPKNHQETPSTGVIAPSIVQTMTDVALTSANIHGHKEEEDDSELDTELLMKTFKVAKRKSFGLGSPKNSQVENHVEEENLQQTKKPIICQDHEPRSGLVNIHSDLLLPSNPCKLVSYEKSPQNSQNSLGKNNVESVSLLQVKSSVLAAGSQQEAFLKTLSNSASPGLSPNKVAKSSQDSRLPTNTDAANTCPLFFSSPATKEAEICSNKGLKNNQSPSLRARQSRTLNPGHIPMETQGNYMQTKISDLNINPCVPLEEIPNSRVNSNHFESSVTPDGLLPEGVEPHEHQVIGPAPSLCKKEGKDTVNLSQSFMPRKRKAQRLASSESELSSEEGDLPTMAQIFKSHHSPSPSGQELPRKSDSSNQDGHQLQEPNPGLQCQSQHGHPLSEPAPGTQLSQFVGPSQIHDGLETVQDNSVRTQIQNDLLQTPFQEECITSSQGSVDLFGTPEESEAVDGMYGNAALSRESSQYSSEIINTQQKEEMQQELRRLERMMALVSEALQRKEADSGAGAQTAEPDPSHSEKCTAADLDKAGNGTDRQSCPDSGRDHVCAPPGPGAPDGLEAPQPHAPPTRGQTKTAGRQARRSGQKPRTSKRQSSQKSQAEAEVKDHSVTLEGSFTEPKEEKEVPRESSVSVMCRLGINCTAGRMELVASGLSASEHTMVKKFARKMKGNLSKMTTPNTTHVIIKTDEDLVCERTLKYFQGIAGQKWVVSYLWITECFKQGKVLDEAQFEVRGDVVNGQNHNGPRRSRTTAAGNLLMTGYEICFQGSFTGMTTDQMEAMVEMCGATVMKDPLMFSKHGNCQLVVVQPGLDDTQSYYRALQKKATVVTRGWLLDTIATYTLQNPEDYKP